MALKVAFRDRFSSALLSSILVNINVREYSDRAACMWSIFVVFQQENIHDSNKKIFHEKLHKLLIKYVLYTY